MPNGPQQPTAGTLDSPIVDEHRRNRDRRILRLATPRGFGAPHYVPPLYVRGTLHPKEGPYSRDRGQGYIHLIFGEQLQSK